MHLTNIVGTSTVFSGHDTGEYDKNSQKKKSLLSWAYVVGNLRERWPTKK